MDLIANMLSTIKNSVMAGRKSTEFPYSKIKEEIVKVMKENNFLENVKVFKPEGKPYKMIHVDFKFDGGLPTISDLVRVSKPGRRIYSGGSKLKRETSRYGVLIVSTSRGIMEGVNARKKKLGGEVICKIL